MSRLRHGFAVGALALLVLPSAASARPGQRSFDQTFPIASRLCTHVAHGQGPIKLRPVSAQVAALCATLSTSFTTTQSGYFATVTPIRQQVIAVQAQTRQACALRPSPTCRTARMQARKTLAGLRAQVRAAAATYRAGNETARRTFWSAIHTLRGGTGIVPDTSVTTVAPPVAIPPAA